MHESTTFDGERHVDLARLALACGIDASWWDSLGQHYEVSDTTFRHLLAGLGVLGQVAADDAEIAAALLHQQQATWRRLLPPVRVVYDGEACGVELVVAEALLEGYWQWQLIEEHGTRGGCTLNATFSPASLNLAGHEGGGIGESRTRLDDQALELRWLALPSMPIGYHELEVTSPSGERAQCHLIVAPRRCYTAADSGVRVWGLSIQLYALRSAFNHGIGDFGDLQRAAEATHALGGDVLGINPLHALFAEAPEEASPYSPSSRVYLNPWYIDILHAPGYSRLDTQELDKHIEPPSSSLEFVDYTAMARYKQHVLEAVFQQFDHAPATDDDRLDFARWRESEGQPLQRYATFELLRELNAATDQLSGWRDWPQDWQDPDSPVVAALVTEHATRVRYHAWLQWVAARQLDAVVERIRELGMSVGLYRDLAVGVSGNGADAWAERATYVDDVHVGAPPDDFSVKGQDWVLPLMNPRTLQESGFAPFRAVLAANMRGAGALRIDHVMGLTRLFCIPAGQAPTAGSYVAAPLEEMLAVLAIESTRAQCIIVGEDLGTVPDGFRERLQEAGVLSYKLMYFEKHYESEHRFRRPAAYAAPSLVSANNHDLPTLIGFWNSSDIALRTALALFPNESLREYQITERASDRQRLLDALDAEGLLPDGIRPENTPGVSMSHVSMNRALIDAVHQYLARTHSQLLILNVEDILAQSEQMNLPGTDRDRYPNWRRRPPLAVEHWAADDRFQRTAEIIRRERN